MIDFEPLPPDLIPRKENKMPEMNPVNVPETPNIYGIEETVDVEIFLCSCVNSVLASLSDDGKITISDYAKFIRPVTKLLPALSGVGLVPRELEDLKEDEKELLIKVAQEELELESNVKEVVSKILNIAYDLKNLIELVKNSK